MCSDISIKKNQYINAQISGTSCGVSVLCLLCSPRGVERRTLQPCSWLVVTGDSALFIGYWEGEVTMQVGSSQLAWQTDITVILSVTQLRSLFKLQGETFKKELLYILPYEDLAFWILSVCGPETLFSSPCLQNQTTAVCSGECGIFPMKCHWASAPHWPCL